MSDTGGLCLTFWLIEGGGCVLLPVGDDSFSCVTNI
jgi:hypothetical protein